MLLSFILVGCNYESPIIIGKGSWESNDFYNEITRIIIEEGYGEKVLIKPVTTPVLVAGLKQKEIHINVETWSENMPSYESDIEKGYYEELSINFNDNEQGIFTTLYFAEYMAEKLDKEINELYIEDLIEFKEYLPKSRDNKSIIYLGTSEWEVTEFLLNKFNNEEVYPNLVNNFSTEIIRSTPILNQMLITAQDNYLNKNEISKDTVWVGYNWKPTAVMGKYEMVLLKDSKDEYLPNEGIGNVPPNNITIVAIPELKEKHPDIYKMLTNFKTSSLDASKALAYLEEDSNRTITDSAIYWLNENKEMWESWVSYEARMKINSYLDRI